MIPEHSTIRLELPFSLDPSVLIKRTGLRARDSTGDDIAIELIERARSIARPKALYRVSVVRHIDNATVDIDGTVFFSRVLSKVLVEQATAFPYLITIGQELDEIELPSRDMWRRYLLDIVKQMVLHSAGQSFSDHLHQEFPFSRLTHINPGEIQDWPIAQQKLLFSILGKAAGEIGVTLSDGYMMKPHKSRSGIYFANNTGFETCRLCTQFKCPGRRAAFDGAALREYTG